MKRYIYLRDLEPIINENIEICDRSAKPFAMIENIHFDLKDRLREEKLDLYLNCIIDCIYGADGHLQILLDLKK